MGRFEIVKRKVSCNVISDLSFENDIFCYLFGTRLKQADSENTMFVDFNWRRPKQADESNPGFVGLAASQFRRS